MKKLLIVDDEPALLGMLTMLMAEEADVITAHSAKDAIEILEWHHPIAVVLSDINCPPGSGFDVYREVQKLNSEGQTRTEFFFMSGNLHEHENELRLLDPKPMVFEKPFRQLMKFRQALIDALKAG